VCGFEALFFTNDKVFQLSVVCSVCICEQRIIFAVFYTHFSSLILQIIVYLCIELY